MKKNIVRAIDGFTDLILSFLILFVPLFFVFAKGEHYYFSIYDIFKEVSVESTAAVLTGLFFLKLFFSEDRVRIKYSPVVWPLLLFLTVMVLSMLQSYNIYESVKFMLRWLGNITVFLVAYNRITDKKKLQHYLNLFVFIGGVVSFYGILQHFKIDFSFLHQNFVGNSTFGNPNFASEAVIIVLPISFALFISETKFYKAVLYMIAFVLMMLFIVLNKTRSVWIGAGFSAMFVSFYVLLNYVRGKFEFHFTEKEIVHVRRIFKVIGVLLFAVMTIVGLSYTPLKSKSSKLQKINNMTVQVVREFLTLKDIELARGKIKRGDTATQRLLIWRNSLNLIRDNSILGVGIGNYKIRYQPYRTEEEQESTGPDIFVRRAHNEYVQFLAELGLPGIILFLLIIIISLRMGDAILRLSPLFYGQALGIGFMYSLLSFYVAIFFNFALQTPTPAMFMFITLAFLSSSYDIFLKKEAFSVILTDLTDALRRFRYPLIPAAFFMFIAPFFLVRPALAYYNYQFGQACEKMGLLPEARKKLEKSVKYYKHSWEANFVLANVCAELSDMLTAKRLHEFSLNLNPYHQKGHYNYANTLYKLGEVDKAIEHYKKGIEIDSIFYQSYNNLGTILFKEGRLEESLEYFKKVIELRPDYFSGQYNMGYILYLLHRYKDAVPYVENACRLKPSNERSKSLLIELRRRLNSG